MKQFALFGFLPTKTAMCYRSPLEADLAPRLPRTSLAGTNLGGNQKWRRTATIFY